MVSLLHPEQASIVGLKPEAEPWSTFPPGTFFEVCTSDEHYEDLADGRRQFPVAYPTHCSLSDLAALTHKYHQAATAYAFRWSSTGQAHIFASHPELPGEYDCTFIRTERISAARMQRLAAELAEQRVSA